MKILNKLTIKSLKLNKKRTLVTIIGIILSTALITVVAGMVTSGQSTLKQYSIDTYGDFHAEFKEVPLDELSYIEENRNVEDYFLSSDLGYAYLNGSTNPDKPYVNIVGYDSAGLTKMPFTITEGRLPQNSDEIVISSSIIYNGEVNLKVGQKINLDVSKRTLEGKELNQKDIYTEDEELEKMYSKEYTIVGIMNRLNYDLEPFTAPGYTVITFLDTTNIAEDANIFVKYKKDALRNYKEVTCSILGMNVEKQKEDLYMGLDELVYGEEPETLGSKYGLLFNTSLLNFEGVGLNNAYMRMLYLVGIIVLVIIIISSVFVIRNSFAISITERTRQYGMLSSIGATKKQIKKNVLFEGFILGIIAIPLGILLGIIVNVILSIVLNTLMRNISEDFTFIFSVPVLAIIFSVVLAGITIYFSCISSARKASKVSPIDAIRSNTDIKIKSKKIKSPKIIKKIFGIGGTVAYKNLKRNKKKYRTTVVSLIVSIMIFISVTSLVQYGFEVSNITYKEVKYNISISRGEQTETEEETYKLYQEIAEMEGVEEYSISRVLNLKLDKRNLKYTEDGKEYVEGYGNDSLEDANIAYTTIYALGEDEYRRYIDDLGLSYDYAKDKVIWMDNYEKYVYYGDNGEYKKEVGHIYNFKKGDKFEAKILKGEEETPVTLEVATLTDKAPMGQEMTSATNGIIIVSDEFIEQYDWLISMMYVDAKDAGKLEQEIKKNYPHVDLYNIENEVKSQNSLILIIAIFLYGFIIVISLIGITNIFNTITSNMNLRSKEFANLKSIGMTKKEFNKMIRLESIFYGTKAILIGVPLGVIGSYLLYMAFSQGIEMSYKFPVMPTIVAIIVVFALIGAIMRYSLNKINKQNIIETIRKDNI